MNTLDEKDKQVQPIIDLHTCIQGEGQLAGVPHILIRLAGCNLRCAFKGSLCDTPYSSWQVEKGNTRSKMFRSLFGIILGSRTL